MKKPKTQPKKNTKLDRRALLGAKGGFPQTKEHVLL